MAKSWDDTNYPYRWEVTVDSPSGNLSNFPFLLILSDDREIDASDMASKRYRIFDSTGTECDYDEEFYIEPGYVNFKIWVRIADLYASPSGDQNKIWVYFGYDPGTDQDNPTGVWDSGFVGVYHLNGNWNDATSNGHNLSGGSGISQGDPSSDSGGVVAGCYSFDGSNDCLYFNEASPMGISGAPFQWECWFYTPVDSDRGILWLGDKDSSQDYWGLFSEQASGVDPLWHSARDVSSNSATTANTQTPNTWHYGVGQEIDDGDGTASRRVVLDWDTANAGTETTNTTPDGADRFGIGGYLDSSPSNFFTSLIDEVRVSNTIRSDAWHTTVKANITEANNEQTWAGAAESKPVGVGNPWYHFAQQVAA